MTQPGPRVIPTRWKVVIEETGPEGAHSLCFHGCEGEDADAAIDYALALLGERAPGWVPMEAWAAKEELCGPRRRLARVRYPAYRREVGR